MGFQKTLTYNSLNGITIDISILYGFAYKLAANGRETHNYSKSGYKLLICFDIFVNYEVHQ